MARHTLGTGLILLLLAGCSFRHVPLLAPGPVDYTEDLFARKSIPTFSVRTRVEDGAPVDTVVGQTRSYRVRPGDTLLDVARYYDLGYNEIVEANPGVDPWVPPVGATLVLPTAWTLPCCTYEGLVLNIPEMRLYSYRHPSGDPRTLIVTTYPVGLGRDDRRTPRGRFKVRGKTVNPSWVIPESIRREHIAERGDPRTVIPPGDPDNPLGKYRLELTIPRYAVHGTNIPWGVGMEVSHGCARLYPEDMERLFPLVTVGTPVAFTYQAVKVGRRAGAVYVEVHPDIYRYTPDLTRVARAELRRQGLVTDVDERLLRVAAKESRGVPFRVSGDHGRLPARP